MNAKQRRRQDRRIEAIQRDVATGLRMLAEEAQRGEIDMAAELRKLANEIEAVMDRKEPR
jgi:hypothetical protein